MNDTELKYPIVTDFDMCFQVTGAIFVLYLVNDNIFQIRMNGAYWCNRNWAFGQSGCLFYLH